MKLTIKRKEQGFTLIELLVVIGILAILLAITLIAINPNKHFQDTRNTQRSSNVSEILNAVYEYEAANNGNMPTVLTNVDSTATPLAMGTAQSASGVAFSTPHVTFTVPSGNLVTSGMVTVTGCSIAADNGGFQVTAGDDTSITVTNLNGVASATSCSITAGINLCTALAPTYIADLPKDPTTGTGAPSGHTPCQAGTTAYDTGYTIAASNGRFTLAAPATEGGSAISVTR